MSRTLAVRLEDEADVLLTGPALRALAATTDILDVLVSPAGLPAAELLPAVNEKLTFDPPWRGAAPPQVDRVATDLLIGALACRGYDRCVIFTSPGHSPLPLALLARIAGIGHLVATTTDEPGTLLDVRHERPPELHEAEVALDLAYTAGGRLPTGDDGRLAVRGPLPDVSRRVPDGPYVVLHPGASAPSRALTPEHAAAVVAALQEGGRTVVVTGREHEASLTAAAAGGEAIDLTGRTSFAQLAAVLAHAECVVTGSSAPAHLAAAVDTPVVCLASPVVPAARWAPFGVETVLLGDWQGPAPEHPRLSGVAPEKVAEAVASLVAGRAGA
ncbi:glycosyltransferase family 9 protein [Georgenia alba]|uniref:Glycosyltransferase family 9 protein n=1 Tax=Georgenia alba TaxID=2233858 RepID=A0ABW2Q2G4_9MICO